MAKLSKPKDAAVSITSGELALFCRQIGTMLVAGVDMLRALRVAGEQTDSVRMRSVAQRIGRDMSAGRVMAWSLSRFPDLFSPFFVHMVRQGESEGVLGEVLTTMADYLEREEGPVPGHLAGPAGSGFDIDEAIAKLKPLIFWQMMSEARRQQEGAADDPADLPPIIDTTPEAERSYPRNGRHFPTDDGDEGAGKKRIQL